MKAACAALALAASLALGAFACGEPCEPVPRGEVGELTAWEQRFLAEEGLPATPARQSLRAEDGLALSYFDWRPSQEPRGVALLLHGSSAHGALYSVLGAALAEAGVLVRIVDLRGHGHSRCVTPSDCRPGLVPSYTDDGATWPGRPGDCADDDQLTRDLQRHLSALQAIDPRPPVLVGHSSGAGLVARYVEKVGMSALSGAALLTPFLHADQPQNTLHSWECGRIVGSTYARVDLGALGDARRNSPHRYVLSLDKPAELTDPLDTVRYTMTMMQGLAVSDWQRAPSSFTGPTLWIAAEHDALLDTELSKQELAKMPGGMSFVTVRGTSHVGVTWSAAVGRLLAEFVATPTAKVPESLSPQP